MARLAKIELDFNWKIKSFMDLLKSSNKAGEKRSLAAGTTFGIVDERTGIVTPAHLFVCSLGASSYTYARLFWHEGSEAWCTGHALAFTFFQGCPEICVPDNPKPVITEASPYEPDVNPSFAQMASHFDVAVIAARVRKPRDKAYASYYMSSRQSNHTSKNISCLQEYF